MAKRARPKAGRADRNPLRPDRQPTKLPPSRTPPVVAMPKAPPPAPALDTAAVGLFQQGMEALQKHGYQRAAERFRALLEKFPEERALSERSRVYLDLCERELNRKPASPKTTEERLTAATAALNSGHDAQAERLVRSVLTSEARHDLALYLMAAIEARRGGADAALDYLTQAVTVSPEVRAQARHDVDFEVLRGSEVFQALIDPPSTPFAPRRGRRNSRS